MKQSTSPSARSLAHALVATWPRRIGWLSLVVAVAATALTGGFASVAPAAVPDTQAGRWVDVGPVRLAPLSWTVRSDVEPDFLEDTDGADAWLIVVADVRSGTAETEQFPDNVLEIPNELVLDEAEPDQVILIRDGSLSPDFQPGVPERVAFLWPVSKSAVKEAGIKKSGDMRLGLHRSRLSTSQVDGSEIWRVADHDAAVVTVPRDDKTGKKLAETEVW